MERCSPGRPSKGLRRVTTDSRTTDALVAVEAEDFGPIASAHIDLRPLTVFVGPSNTGKSYMAMLIYALHRLVSGPSQRHIRHSHGRSLLDQDQKASLSPASAHDVLAGVNAMSAGRSPLHTIPPAMVEHVRARLIAQPSAPKALADEVAWCLGLRDTATLSRRNGDRSASVTLNTRVSLRHESPLGYSYRYTLGPGEGSVMADIPMSLQSGVDHSALDWFDLAAFETAAMIEDLKPPEEVQQERARVMLDNLTDSVFRSSLGPLGRPAHYLPADRSGIMHAHTVVVRSLIDQASHAGIGQPESLPMFSGVLADFLAQLIDLPRRGSHASLEALAGELESSMLSGEVVSEKSEVNYPSYHYRPRGWQKSLPLMTSSSMVSELAPLVLFMKHVVRKNQVLIIEEPESHLHPAMQVQLARFLAKTVQNGVRVIVTTHSEVVLETLANLTAVGQLPEHDRQGLPASETALSPADVGVWLFTLDETEGGSTVQEIGLDEGGGTYPVGYDKVNEALYNDWADILDRREKVRSR